MRSITSITTPPSGPELVTLDDVKLEFGITNSDSDDQLNLWIKQASQIAASYCQQVLAAQTVTETFRHSLRFTGDGYRSDFYLGTCRGESAEALILGSSVVRSITSITLDGAALPVDQYELDEVVYRLNSSGYPASWLFSKAIVVIYASGFTVGVDVPDDLQRAVMMMVREARGIASRTDPTLKVRETVGVSRLEWWVPTSATTSLPIEISGLLDQYKRDWAWMT